MDKAESQSLETRRTVLGTKQNGHKKVKAMTAPPPHHCATCDDSVVALAARALAAEARMRNRPTTVTVATGRPSTPTSEAVPAAVDAHQAGGGREQWGDELASTNGV